MSTRTRQRLLAVLLVAVLGTSLATTGWLLSGRSEQQATLASVSAQLTDRDEEVASLEAEATEAAEQAREVARLTDTVAELQSELAETETQLEERDDTIEQLRADLSAAESAAAAASAPSPSPSTSMQSDADGGACARLFGGAFEETGGEMDDEDCANLERDIAECNAAMSSDPDYVQYDLGLYEHVETGEITGCDI